MSYNIGTSTSGNAAFNIGQRSPLDGGGGGEVPLSLNPAAWWDFSDSSTITIATGVSQINDKSGNSNTATQGTGSRQPSIISAAQNGLDVARFNGVDNLQVSNSSELQITDNATFFITVVSSGFNRCIFSKGNKAGGGDPGAPNYFLELNLTGGVANDFSLFDGTDFRIPGTGYTFTTFSNIDMVWSKSVGNVEFFANGSSLGAVSTSVTWKVSTDNFAIGVQGANDLSNPLNGDIGEIVLFNRTLSTSEQSAMRNYLSNKWGT